MIDSIYLLEERLWIPGIKVTKVSVISHLLS